MASSAETSTPTNQKHQDNHVETLRRRDLFEVEESPPADTVPLLNVLAKLFSQVIEFCKEHISNEELLEMIVVAEYYLEVTDLLDQISQATADRIQNKSVEYVRKCFSHVQVVHYSIWKLSSRF
ncbi:hypothetical protein DKX38_023572 [Salix brachista]|uniref:Uncharacterized protein n=1 Tax=Salix brachista TaxID=2182728 RepID=A0A5N5JPM1_9ROSI|nr:hypothetical protein DKX38_023572 [Salix brachista]